MLRGACKQRRLADLLEIGNRPCASDGLGPEVTPVHPAKALRSEGDEGAALYGLQHEEVVPLVDRADDLLDEAHGVQPAHELKQHLPCQDDLLQPALSEGFQRLLHSCLELLLSHLLAAPRHHARQRRHGAQRAQSLQSLQSTRALGGPTSCQVAVCAPSQLHRKDSVHKASFVGGHLRGTGGWGAWATRRLRIVLAARASLRAVIRH
mmetsp:Transcript_45188/g.117100  ORF Transcript_45188/g.117100 Transcript_45188/m.117100 type:complete len:208 (+) Transcript_45188:441-1064(+)